MHSKLAFLAAMLLSTTAFAQSTSTSNSSSQSGSSVVTNSSVPSSQTIRTTGTAIAPALTAAGVNSCAGSTGGAVGGTGFGISFGTTYEMQECNRRAYAATLAGMGQNLAALDLVCRNEEVRVSLNNTGIICPSQRIAAAGARTASIGSDDFFYDSRGRKFREVPRGTRGATRSASGEYVLLVK